MTSNARIYRYVVNRGEWYWAIALLCEDGMLAVWSDCGAYVYHWGYGLQSGKDIRRLLLRMEDDYLVRKLACERQEFDGEKTREIIREHILDYRRQGSYSREFAAREWELWKRTDFYHEIDAHGWYEQTQIDDAAELISYGPPRKAQHFVARIWPKLRAAIQEELDREQAAVLGHVQVES